MTGRALLTLAAALVTALAATAPLSVAAQTRSLQAAGDWQIDSDDESCTLRRSYSALSQGDSALYIRSYGPGAASQVSITGPTMLRDDRRATLASVGFGDDEAIEQLGAIATAFNGQPMLVFQLGIPRPGSNQLATFGRGRVDVATHISTWMPPQAREMHVDAPDMDAQTVQLGDMSPPLALLFACEDSLLEAWGFDAEAQNNLTRQPELTNHDRVNYWIIYPPNLGLNRVSSIVQFRVRVDANGEVNDCVIQAPAWNRRVLRQSCRAIAQGAQFTPALDAQGNPVPALWRATMLFLMFD